MISAASLVYEITLTRLFAVQQFHHFAFVVISIATMGFAASGVILSIRDEQPAMHLPALGFSAVVLLAYLTINSLPFDSYSLAWDRRQWWILILYFVVSGLPFLAAGWTVGLALNSAGEDAFRPYAANLIGSALGCPLALLALQSLGGEGAIGLVICMGLLTAALLAPRMRTVIAILPLSLIVMVAFSLPLKAFELVLSPYKPLHIASLAKRAHHTLSRWGATSRIDVLESPGIHTYPGLSLNLSTQLPPQVGIFVDGEGPLPITQAAPDQPVASEIAVRMPASIAYTLRPVNEALILDWGASAPALYALSISPADVWLPKAEPILIETLKNLNSDANGWILDRQDLHLMNKHARGALARRDCRFDVIEYALSDSYHPVTSGAFSLKVDYLLTVESFMDAWRCLDQDGLLVITRWIGTPPAESARAWTTLLSALRSAGVAKLDEHVAAFRGMRTVTMIATPHAFSGVELRALRAFLDRNAFDVIILPDLKADELNRYNRLPEPVYHNLFMAALKTPETAIAGHTLRLDPPVDDKPFFFHFFRWSQTSEIFTSLGLYWQPFGGSGYFVLIVLMGLMVALALLLVVGSLLFRTRLPGSNRPEIQFLLFFASLGIGYLAIEIALIQQFSLLLDYPAYSLAGVLFILLLGSGFGSWLSPRIATNSAMLALLGYLGLVILAVPNIIHALLPAPGLARWLALALLLAPLGILMGVPFAAGLRRLERSNPGWIPWAWAVNGAFSGISGVAATMIALDLGFQATLISGLLAYALAAMVALQWMRADPSAPVRG